MVKCSEIIYQYIGITLYNKWRKVSFGVYYMFEFI